MKLPITPRHPIIHNESIPIPSQAPILSQRVRSDPIMSLARIGIILAFVLLFCLGFIITLFSTWTGLVAGFELLVSAHPIHAISSCLDTYDFHTGTFKSSQKHDTNISSISRTGGLTSRSFFCSRFAYPAIALAEYARNAAVIEVQNMTVKFNNSTSGALYPDISRQSSCFHVVDVIASARYHLRHPPSCNGTDCNPLTHHWAQFVTKWLAPEVRIVSPVLHVSLVVNNTLPLKTIIINLEDQPSLDIPLDGKMGAIEDVVVQAYLCPSAISEVAQIIGDWSSWLTEDGPVGGISAGTENTVYLSSIPPTKTPPSKITMSFNAIGDAHTSGFIPLTFPNVLFSKHITLDPAQSVGDLLSHINFTHLDVDVIEPTHLEGLDTSMLKIQAQAETIIPFADTIPIKIPHLSITSIPQVQFTVSMPSECLPKTQGQDDYEYLIGLANITVGLQIDTVSSRSNLGSDGLKAILRATSWVNNIPETATKMCPDGGRSPLDTKILDYINGRDLILHASNPSEVENRPGNDIGISTPSWIPQLLAKLSIPVRLPIPPPPSPLVNRLVLQSVKLDLPALGGHPIGERRGSSHILEAQDIDNVDNIAITGDGDQIDPMRQTLINLDAFVMAYISLPVWPFPVAGDRNGSASTSQASTDSSLDTSSSTMDEIIQVAFIRAPESVVFFEDNELGILDIRDWQTANSTLVNSNERSDPATMSLEGNIWSRNHEANSGEDDELDNHPFLKVQALISNAPLRVTNQRTLALLIKRVVFYRRPANMSIETKIGAAIHIAGFEKKQHVVMLNNRFRMTKDIDAVHIPNLDPETLIILDGIPASGSFIMNPKLM